MDDFKATATTPRSALGDASWIGSVKHPLQSRQQEVEDGLRLALSDPAMRSRSAELGDRIRSEHGTRTAAQWYSSIGA